MENRWKSARCQVFHQEILKQAAKKDGQDNPQDLELVDLNF